MAKDKETKEREDDNLEQFGVWVKAGSDGIQEMEAEPIEIDDSAENDQLYITEEEEDLLNELDSSEEDGGMDFDGLGDEDFNLDSIGGDDLTDDLDFSDVASIEETIEDSLPDFDDIPEEPTLPIEEAVDKLEAQTELLEESSRQLDILEKIESELSTIRNEIKDLKDEISTIRMAPRDEQGDESLEIPEDEQGAGFFDDSDLDETIALTGDELDNILDGAVPEEEPEEDEELLLQPEETLPEDEFQEESDLLADTPLEITEDTELTEPDEDPALSMLTNMEDESELLDAEEDKDSLEITIDDQGEADEEEISLDNLLDDEDISLEEVSLDDLTGAGEESESLEISNADEVEEIVNIDDVEPSEDVEEIDIEDMVEASPDDDLVIEEVDLDDLGIDLSEFSDDSDNLAEDESEEPLEVPEAPAAPVEPDETLFDEGEEVSLDEIDGDIVFEDEASFAESDEIESVDLSEFSEESFDTEEIDSLEDIQLDEISPDSNFGEDESNSVEPLSSLKEEESAIEFEETSLDDFLDQTEELEEDDEPLNFPEEEDNVEFPLPPEGSDDDTLIDNLAAIENEIDMEDLSENPAEEDDFTQIEIPEDMEDLVIGDEAFETEEIIMGEEIPEEEELVIEEEFPKEEELVIEEEIPMEDVLDIEEEITETEEIDLEEDISEAEDNDLEEDFSADDEETILDEGPVFEAEEEAETASGSMGFDLDESILSTDDEVDDDFIDLDLDLDLDDELSPDDGAVKEEAADEDVSESFSIEIEDGTSDEIDLSSDELETVPAEDLSIDDENIDELLDGISLSEDLGDFAPGEATEEEPLAAESEQVEEPETVPEPEEIPSIPDIAAIRDSDELASLPYDLKEEIKEVLTYMDQLLEALPEDKIQEFARSEHFEVYKKIFTELGIAK